MRCEEFEEIVFSGREPLPGERANMLAHAAQCEACRALIENADVLCGARSLDDALEVPDAFAQRWRAAVRRECAPKAGWRERLRFRGGRSLLVRGAAYACGALLLVGLGTAIGSRSLDSASDAAAQDWVMARNYSAEASDGGMLMSASFGGAADSADDGRRIVRTASLSLKTPDMDAALEAICAQTAQAGGSVTSCDVSGTRDDGRSASIQLEIPEAALDGFLSGAGEWGTVTQRRSSARDMTAQYQDNDSRLESAMAQKQRLDALYAEAQDMADIITITDAIFDVQQEIDALAGANRSIDAQAENAQVTLSLTEEFSAEDAPLTARLIEEARSGFARFGELLGGLALLAAYALPWLLLIGAAAGLFFGVRAIRRHSSPKKTKHGNESAN